MGICFRLVSITPGLAFALGSVGSSGSGAMGAGALVLHPRLISVTTGCHRQPPACLSRGPQPCWCVLPAHSACQLRGPAALALPGLATCALGTQHCPWGWAVAPLQRGARGGAEGYFTGYFTCWHQLFLPSAPTTFHPPEPALTSPPQGIAAAVPPFCCVPLLFPLALALIAQHLPLYRSHLHWFLIVGSVVVLGEGLLCPRMPFEAGSGVALRYEDKTTQLGAGTTGQWCLGWWKGEGWTVAVGLASSPRTGSVTRTGCGHP